MTTTRERRKQRNIERLRRMAANGDAKAKAMLEAALAQPEDELQYWANEQLALDRP